MKIKSVQIQKFRSIDDATLSFGQILAIVGANNSGKSHILRALNAFFNFEDERAGFNNQDHVYSLKSRPKITVVFNDIKEADGVPKEYLHGDELCVRLTYRWDRRSTLYEVIVANQKISIDSQKFADLLSRFRFIYVPIIRNYTSTFSAEEGIAHRLLSETFRRQVQNRNNIQPLVDKLTEKIEKTVLRSAVKDIMHFYPFEKESEFSMRIEDSSIVDSMLKSVVLTMLENSQSNDIKNCGSGIQSAMYFAISLAMSMNGNCNFLVGIEEPELNMHPQAQRHLIDSIKDTSKYPNTQFVLTTHSTVIIDKIGHTSIALCRKTDNSTRHIVSSFSQVCEGFWDQYGFSQERYENFFLFKNSDFFFSNYIVIAESPTDCQILECLLSEYGIDAEKIGISFIPTDGERSIKYPYALAKELKIPYVCIVDRDVFQPYINGKRKESLDDDGVPRYSPEIKESSPICDFLSPDDLTKLLDLFIKCKYTEILALLKQYRIISMRYALEVDLVICSSYLNSICAALRIPENQRSQAYLLKEMGTRIKKLDVIKFALQNTPRRNLPKSFRCIINSVKEMIELE